MKPISLSLSFIFFTTLAFAADKKPKEMKPKLVEAATVLVKDNFDGDKLDPRWISEAAGAGISIEDGALRIEGPAGGARGLAEVKFAAPQQNVHLQFLLKPRACQSIAIGYRQKTAFGYVVYGEIGRFSVGDRTPQPAGGKSPFERVTVDTKEKDPKDWQRICIECKGRQLLVRLNGKTIVELEHDFVAEEKTALVLAGYGGVFMMDEVLIATLAKK